jgi:hypothetical protein
MRKGVVLTCEVVFLRAGDGGRKLRGARNESKLLPRTAMQFSESVNHPLQTTLLYINTPLRGASGRGRYTHTHTQTRRESVINVLLHTQGGGGGGGLFFSLRSVCV